jgi:hypothetical protein
MRFSAEMEVWRDGVLEQLDQQITTEQQRHRTDYSLGRTPALQSRSPDAHTLGNNLKEDRCQHESRTQGDEVFEKALSKPVSAGPDQHKTANEISACSKQTKKEKAGKSSVIEIHLVVHQTGKFGLKHCAQIYIMVFPLPITDRPLSG